MRTDFEDCLELITDEKINKFVKKALKHANKGFWTCACSASNKYHPPENQVDGGLIIHSRKMVQIAVSLFRFFRVKNEVTKSKIIAAVILHDICKRGIDWKVRFARDHGPKAAEWLYGLCTAEEKGSKDIKFVISLVRDHMAVWNYPEPTPALKKNEILKNSNIAHLIVQLSDYWSSRTWCPFVADEIVPA